MATTNHITPVKLMDLAQAQRNNRAFALSSWEEAHLLECWECQDTFTIFIRDTNDDDEIDDDYR